MHLHPSNGDKDGGGVDGDGSGGTSPSRQGAGTETSVPRNLSAMAAALRMFLWNMTDPSRFMRRGQYIGERASEGTRGAHTIRWRARRWARATLWCGHLVAPLRLPFGLRVRDEIVRSLLFVPSNSENISLSTFLKRKNSRKQELALWHLVNRLVPENA